MLYFSISTVPSICGLLFIKSVYLQKYAIDPPLPFSISFEHSIYQFCGINLQTTVYTCMFRIYSFPTSSTNFIALTSTCYTCRHYQLNLLLSYFFKTIVHTGIARMIYISSFVYIKKIKYNSSTYSIIHESHFSTFLEAAQSML